MSQSHSVTESSSNEIDEQSALTQNNIDWCLSYYIDLTENTEQDVSTNVILFLPGMIITGVIISASEYMEKSGLDNLWRELVGKDDGKEFFKPRHFIHLKDAKFFMSAQEIASCHQVGTLWRGQLSMIAGFSLGTLSGELR